MTTQLFLSFFAGSVLGIIFFGGLWWTVRKGVTANNPALWFFGSAIIRMSIALAGLYFVMAGDWQRLLAALVGFVVVRVILTRFIPLFNQNSNGETDAT